MNDHSNEPGADGAPADDLRSSIMAAMRGEDTGGTPSPDTSAAEPAARPAAGEADPPAGETDAQRAARLRDDRGRFAKDGNAAQDAQGKPQAATEAKPGQTEPGEAAAAEAAPAATDAPRPPHGWSPASKAAFAELPQHVQADVAKREAEVNRGLAKLQDYKGLERYADMAKASGTTLTAAFDAYQASEAKLRSDFTGGIRELCSIFGANPAMLAAGLLGVEPRELHARLTGSHAGQSGNDNNAGENVPPHVAEMLRQQGEAIKRLSADADARQRASEKSAYDTASSVIEAFFNDPANVYAHNVEQTVVQLVSQDPNAGRDLQGALRRAYDTALYLNPETRELVINDQIKARQAQTVAQSATTVSQQVQATQRARQAAKSVTGSPMSGAAASTQPAATLREELQRAFAGSRV